MAIKVGGTEVVDDSRVLKHISSIDGATATAFGAGGVGGQTTKLSTTTVSSNVGYVDITLPTSSYKYLRLHVTDIKCTQNNAHAYVRMIYGATQKSMYYANRNINSNVADLQSSGTTLSLSHNTMSNSTEVQLFGFIDIHIPTERNTAFQWFMGYSQSGSNQTEGTFGVATFVADNSQMLIDKFRFAFSTGDVSNGVFTLYGVA